MPQRFLLFLFIVVLARSLVFVIWGHAHFDADQAILGLMAYDISRLNGLVLFFYGQKYLLGFLDWLAAPLFMLVGPSISALKAPLVVINLAVVYLLFRHLRRDAQLKAKSAALCALIFALPSVAVTSRLVEAQGANVEAFLTILLLWTFRANPVLAGVVAGLGYLNREFTLYGIAALFVVEFPRARAEVKVFVQRWLTGLCTASLAIWTVSKMTRWSLNYFASAAPTPVLQPYAEINTNWNYFVEVLLPNLFGASPQPLSVFNIVSALQEGSMLSGLLLLAAFGSALIVIGRNGVQSLKAPAAKFPLFLVLTGLLSALGFILFRNGVRDLMCLRYVLLFILFPIGIFALAFQAQKLRRPLALTAGGILVWTFCNTISHVKLWQEYALTTPSDELATLKNTLVEKGLKCGSAPYWTAYSLAFYGLDSLKVASSTAVRIPEFQSDVELCPGTKFSIADTPRCADAEPVARWFLCQG